MPGKHLVNYDKALADLDPILRRRLCAIAALAGMTELEALELIVETSKISVGEGPETLPIDEQDPV